VSRSSGIIYSPEYMDRIPNNITCTWTLNNGKSVGLGMSLKLDYSLSSDPRTSPAEISKDVLMVGLSATHT